MLNEGCISETQRAFSRITEHFMLIPPVQRSLIIPVGGRAPLSGVPSP